MGIVTKMNPMGGLRNGINGNGFKIEVKAYKKMFGQIKHLTAGIHFFDTTTTSLVTVDWGDGIIEEVGNEKELTHEYSSEGVYVISIISQSNKYPFFKFVSGDIHVSYKYILTPYPEVYVNDSPYTDFSSLFSECGVVEVPENIFIKCPQIIDLSGAFKGCNIVTIPQKIFYNCKDVVNFSYCFSENTGLISVPSDLFFNNKNVTDFSYCFFKCSNITSEVPKLWETHPNALHQSCFKGCTKASNYADIPDDWK